MVYIVGWSLERYLKVVDLFILSDYLFWLIVSFFFPPILTLL